MMSFSKKVYLILKKIPRGKVTTYGEVARAIGKPGAARAVGNALNKNPHAPQIPCHRIVRSNGLVGGYAKGVRVKIKMLVKEGVKVQGEKINLREFGFKF